MRGADQVANLPCGLSTHCFEDKAINVSGKGAGLELTVYHITLRTKL